MLGRNGVKTGGKTREGRLLVILAIPPPKKNPGGSTVLTTTQGTEREAPP